MNNPSNQTKRLVFMFSGVTDAVIGAVLLLIGFGWLPVEAAKYGLENWHINLLGAIMFIVGVATFVYNLSRLQE
jgi:multisubunit Na+/H+ antiporter MnhB subunit